MTKDEALKLALEALKTIDEAMPFPVAKLAQAAIKEALAQPEPEYLAFMDVPHRPWVGLTGEDKKEWIDAMPWPPEPRHIMILIDGIESELKELNT